MKDDYHAVLQLLRLNTPQYFAKEEEDDFALYLKGRKECYFVVLFQQNVVGCGGINFVENTTTARISWDIFHPDYQRKNLGSRLLYYRLDIIKGMNSIQKIQVRTSQLAYGFYEKHGFETFEIILDYWSKGIDLYNMKMKDY